MRSHNILSLLALLLIFSACSSSKKTEGVWLNKEKMAGKQFNNIFIVVMTADPAARAQVENDLAAAAIAKGFKAVKSLDVMPISFDSVRTPTKEEIVSKVQASGCDAVLVAALLKKETALKYTAGGTGYATVPYYGWNGGNYYGYYTNYHQTVNHQGYYNQDEKYVMQSNIYDAASEEIMCTVQSEIFKPVSLIHFSKNYTRILIEQLEKQGLLKK